ncbi:GNAT family N-acetyltransferase [Halomarina salina]|uniref:GNAT family N-acetyltransferase n=1 Tax=Halomarina salina TaxID=1872699 RepID=A0ABD5RMG9_9EURY|nr:GNAT family N-acetyltransferase [Halomarina salina]
MADATDGDTPSHVVVREASTEDVPGIRRVAREGWHAAYGDFLAAETVERALYQWYAPAVVERTVTDPDVAYLVAEPADLAAEDVDHTVLGYVSGHAASGRYGSVSSFYVDPDRWGEGIGNALFGRELAVLASNGVERVELEVLAENEVGRGFYESRGFDAVGESADDLFGTVHPVVVYARDV